MELHPVFIRPTRNGKAIVATIVEMESLGLTGIEDRFIIASTGKATMLGKVSITLNSETELTVPQYMKAIKHSRGIDDDEIERGTRGMHIDNVLTAAFWFSKKVKTALELMGL